MSGLKTLSPEQIALLKKPLPKEAVTQHPTKKFLSSIKAIYVIERLNDVFGIGKYKLKSTVINDKDAMVIVQSFLVIEEYGIELESFGGNDNSDKGDAYKGATTDALTKICSMLEIGMDVFKGLSDKPVQSEPEDARPWLNENVKEFLEAVGYIKANGPDSIKKIEVKYRLSKTVKTKLLEAVNK